MVAAQVTNTLGGGLGLVEIPPAQDHLVDIHTAVPPQGE